MKIKKLEIFEKKILKVLDNLNDFCSNIESEYKENEDIELVHTLKKIKKSNEDERKATKEKAILYSYEHSISFSPTTKVKENAIFHLNL